MLPCPKATLLSSHYILLLFYSEKFILFFYSIQSVTLKGAIMLVWVIFFLIAHVLPASKHYYTTFQLSLN